MILTRTILSCSLILASVACCFAQQSGVPGDGIPDFYYFPQDGQVNTSLGMISRPAGTMAVDTDGTDVIAALIRGDEPVCELCAGGFLPDPNNPPFNVSVWEFGFINDAAQWIKTTPLTTEGFVGVIGEYENPDGLFPELGLGNYGPGLTDSDFPRTFEDGFGIIFAANAGGNGFTNVTVVPEPATGLLIFVAVGTVVLRRRT